MLSFPGIRHNVPLSDHTTIGIGGPARHFAPAEDTAQLASLLSEANRSGLPVLLLGGGSNLLPADAGWPGLVIRIAIGGIDEEKAPDGRTRLTAGAGVEWDHLAAHCVSRGLQGVECLSGIPGSTGAAPIQNIGAYGQEARETIEWVEALDMHTGQPCRFKNEECGFRYRWSRFKGPDRGRFAITRVSFLLRPDAPPAIRYRDLIRHFEQTGSHNPAPSLAETRDAVLAIRRAKGMVIDPADPDSRGCGSFFMNPVVDAPAAARVRETAARRGILREDETMPEFPADDGVKLSAAWLMERSGLQRGMTRGSVGLSTKHILAIINRGSGTAREVLELAALIQHQVQETFGIALEPEPVILREN